MYSVCTQAKKGCWQQTPWHTDFHRYWATWLKNSWRTGNCDENWMGKLRWPRNEMDSHGWWYSYIYIYIYAPGPATPPSPPPHMGWVPYTGPIWDLPPPPLWCGGGVALSPSPPCGVVDGSHILVPYEIFPLPPLWCGGDVALSPSPPCGVVDGSHILVPYEIFPLPPCGVVGVWHCPPPPPVVWWRCGMVWWVCMVCMVGLVWHVWKVWYVWYVW